MDPNIQLLLVKILAYIFARRRMEHNQFGIETHFLMKFSVELVE